MASLSGRILGWSILRVLARYRSLGLATFEEHVLVQLSVVLEYGAHSVHTGDLWNE